VKERGMIFNADMVNAILSGRKTMTRRIMKPQPEVCPRGGHWWPSNVFKTMLHIEDEMQNGKGGWDGLTGDACPFGDVGDRIWVRETFRVHSKATDLATLVYRASERNSWTEQTHRVPASVCNKPVSPEKWTPAIHMPRWASRITLEITGVRVERLQDISEEDARAEGVIPACGGVEPYWEHRFNFRELWFDIYGEESWRANPFVWVMEFKRIEGGAE